VGQIITETTNNRVVWHDQTADLAFREVYARPFVWIKFTIVQKNKKPRPFAAMQSPLRKTYADDLNQQYGHVTASLCYIYRI